MSEFPDISTWGNTTTGATVIDDIQAILAATLELPGAEAFSELVISSGVVVASSAAHTINTESGDIADNLDKIQVTNVRNGAVLVIRPANTGHVVTVRHMQGGSGQIYLASTGTYIMDSINSALVLQLVGTTWFEVARISGSTMSGENQERFTTTGTFTVPTGITKIFVSGCGGGGGGGGGAGSEDNPGAGANGASGVASTISGSISFNVAGGSGGFAATTPQGGEDREQGGGPGQNSYINSGGHGGAGGNSPHGYYGVGGHGGRGGSGATSGDLGGGGGGGGGVGASLDRVEYSVTPGAELDVTIGSGGAGGAGGGNGSSGSSGTNGTILIEW